MLQFKNYNHSLKVPFALYAVFEIMLQKFDTCQPSGEAPYINAYQKHASISFAYYIKYSNENCKPPIEYSGIDASRVLYENLKEDALHIAKKYYDKNVPMKLLTEAERILFETAKFPTFAKKSLMTFQ